MASSNSKQGGDLFDMAKDGTKIPGDAGQQRIIPSVPRPDQKAENQDDLGAPPSAAAAADNAIDIPRQPADMTSSAGEVITGTGDTMPGQQQTKNLHFGAGNPLAKGSQRYDKHTKSTSEFDGPNGPEIAAAPGEEGDDQEAIRDRKQG